MAYKTKKNQSSTPNYEEKTLNSLSMRVYESGFASLSVNLKEGTIVINGHIHETKDGSPFFAFPSYKGSDGKYYNSAYALGDDIKTDIELLVKQLTE